MTANDTIEVIIIGEAPRTYCRLYCKRAAMKTVCSKRD